MSARPRKAPAPESPIASARLLTWILAPIAVLAAAGAYPTWLVAGRQGLWAQAWSGGIVLTVMVACSLLVKCFTSSPAGMAAFVFVALGMVRIFLCVGLTIAAWAVLGLPPTALLIWMATFYLAALLGESGALGRALLRPTDQARTEGENAAC